MQIPVDVIADKELGAQGAAMAAGIAAGIYSDYRTAIARTVKITETVLPRLQYKDIYEEKYSAYRSVIEGMAGVWKYFEN